MLVSLLNINGNQLCMAVQDYMLSYFSGAKWINSCVVILSVMLRYHLSTAVSCASVVITIIGNILLASEIN